MRWGMFVLGLALAIAPAAAQTEVQRAKAFTDAFLDWSDKAQVEQGAIAVFHDGKPVAGTGVGGRTADTSAPVGSLSKSITALCVSRLVDRGTLGWNDRLGDRLKDYLIRAGRPVDPRVMDVTITQLLTHRSGIPRTAPLTGVEGGPAPGMRSPLEEQARRALALPLDFAPGAKYSYSNQAYIVLALIVAQASGRPYEQVCKAEALAPLGVTTAQIGPTRPQFGRSGAGGWMISANDYARVALALAPDAAGQGKPTRDWIAARRGDTPAYALGYRIDPWRGPGGSEVLQHTGLLNGPEIFASAIFVTYPGGWTVTANVQPARGKAIGGLRRRFDAIMGAPSQVETAEAAEE